MNKDFSNYATLYVVRHGQTEHNINGLLQGQSDSPLTAEGLKQAEQLSETFKGIHFDAVFSSDLLRAQRTAELLSINHKLAITATALLRERRSGRFEGTSIQHFREEMKELLAEKEKLSEKEQLAFKFAPEIESDAELHSRFLTFLREIALTYAGKTILTVTHGAMIQSLLIHFGFAKMSDLPPGSINNLGYFVLLSDGVDFIIKETSGIRKVSSI